MPELEDVYEMDDGFSGDSEDIGAALDSNGRKEDRNGCLNRLAIRHAIEARREQKRIARDLDAIDSDIDDF